tara:strand:- start:1996 stop:2367 length:372 start_codon:yes stop_codon:yes gene_type:complete
MFSESWFRSTRVILLTLAVLIVGALLTTLSWQGAIRAVNLEDQDRFEEETGEGLELIQERMETYGQVIRGLKGLFVASNRVDREEFRNYANELALNENYPGILGIAFAQDLDPESLDAHIERI